MQRKMRVDAAAVGAIGCLKRMLSEFKLTETDLGKLALERVDQVFMSMMEYGARVSRLFGGGVCALVSSNNCVIMIQGVDDNSDVFKLPDGVPVLEQIKTELDALFPKDDKRVGLIVSSLQERLDINGSKFWKT